MADNNNNDWLAGAGMSALSGAINVGVGTVLGKEQYKYQQKLQDSQNLWAEQQVDKANEYNSAASQVNRLLQAGLNPGAAYGSGNAGTSGVASSSAMSAPSLSTASPLLPDLGLQYLQYKQAHSAMSYQDAMAQRTLSEKLGLDIDNTWKNQMNSAQYHSIQASTNHTNANILYMQFQAQMQGTDMYLKQVHTYIDYMLAEGQLGRYETQNTNETNLARAQVHRMNVQNRNESAMTASNIKVNNQNIEESKSRQQNNEDQHEYSYRTMSYRVADAIVNHKSGWLDLEFKTKTFGDRTELVKGQVKLQDGQIVGMKLDNEFKDRTMDARVAQEWFGAAQGMFNTVSSAANAAGSTLNVMNPLK